MEKKLDEIYAEKSKKMVFYPFYLIAKIFKIERKL